MPVLVFICENKKKYLSFLYIIYGMKATVISVAIDMQTGGCAPYPFSNVNCMLGLVFTVSFYSKRMDLAG